jgi:hypothetical protein
MRPKIKIADLPPDKAKFMDKIIEAASEPFAESIGIPLNQAKRAVAGLIDRGLARIEMTGDKGDPETWRARLVLTGEGEAEQ